MYNLRCLAIHCYAARQSHDWSSLPLLSGVAVQTELHVFTEATSCSSGMPVAGPGTNDECIHRYLEHYMQSQLTGHEPARAEQTRHILYFGSSVFPLSGWRAGLCSGAYVTVFLVVCTRRQPTSLIVLRNYTQKEGIRQRGATEELIPMRKQGH